MSESSDDGDDDDKDRAQRVRDRRSRRDRDSRDRRGDDEDEEQTSSTSQTQQTSNTSQTSQTTQTEQSEQTEPTEQSGSADTTSQMSQTQSDSTEERSLDEQPIKERTHETFYLREDLRRELRRITGQASLDFEMEYNAELEKNRHLRPLLLHLGAKKLEEMEPEEIENALNETEILDNVSTDS
jgi:hypothetical protein